MSTILVKRPVQHRPSPLSRRIALETGEVWPLLRLRCRRRCGVQGRREPSAHVDDKKKGKRHKLETKWDQLYCLSNKLSILPHKKKNGTNSKKDTHLYLQVAKLNCFRKSRSYTNVLLN